MTRAGGTAVAVLIVACAGGLAACSLKRPDVIPARMLEPELIEPPPTAAQPVPPRTSTPISIRLLDTEARGHIGRRLLHQQAGGELIEDAVWRWSSTPDRYLDSALRLALASSPDVRLVDTINSATMAVMLVVWQLESAASPQLVGAVELSVIAADRSVRTQTIRKSEPVSADLPGNLAAAAGRLLHSLASESLARAIQAASSKESDHANASSCVECERHER